MTFLHELYSNYRERDLLCQNKKKQAEAGRETRQNFKTWEMLCFGSLFFGITNRVFGIHVS